MRHIDDLADNEFAVLIEFVNIAVKTIGAQAVSPSASLIAKLESAKEVSDEVGVAEIKDPDDRCYSSCDCNDDNCCNDPASI